MSVSRSNPLFSHPRLPRFPARSLSTTVALGAVALFALPAQFAHAQLTFYNSRTDFTSANPGLTGEDFENTSAGTNRAISGPISSATAGSTFLAVVPGFSVQAVGTTGVPGSGLNEIFYNNAASFNTGNGTNVLTTSSSQDSQDVTFSSSVNAFGFDLGFSDTAYTISVFDSVGTLLGTTNSSPTYGTFSFVGVTSTGDIGRVNIASNNTAATTDNFLLGRASSAAPEPSTLPLLGVGLTLGAVMVSRRRETVWRRKAMKPAK